MKLLLNEKINRLLSSKILLTCSMLLNMFLVLSLMPSSNLHTSYRYEIYNGNPRMAYYCRKYDQQERLLANDLSVDPAINVTFVEKVPEWDICNSSQLSPRTKPRSNQSLLDAVYDDVKYCQFHSRIEQQYQLNLFHDMNGTYSMRFQNCVLLPPPHYRWPRKYVKFPPGPEEAYISWSNLGLSSYKDVRMFNPRYPKNVYHFNAHYYDFEQEKDLNVAAQYIPFGSKIRIMLDIGAGGGSLSIALSKRYDVTVLNTIRPEFPYCEYISERGALCIILNSLKTLPFAKFSFDVVHHSWVFQSSTPEHWRTILLEQNRILRLGGYLWMSSGISYAQYDTIRYLLVHQLGYGIVYEEKIEVKTNNSTYFSINPFQLKWTGIYIKPQRLKNNAYPCSS